jgi:glycosyltransferase involved in cell wall biosynthesis
MKARCQSFLGSKNTIFFAYNFPPKLDVQCFRTVNIVKSLAERGWNVTVITTSRFGEHINESQDIPACVNVVRVHDPRLPPQSVQLQNGYILPVLLGDATLPWVVPAVMAARYILQRIGKAVVYSVNSPASGFLAGTIVSRHNKLPHILDYRDQWISENPYVKLNQVHRFVARLVESWILQHATDVLTISQSTADLIERARVTKKKVRVIRNGFDESLLEKAEPYNFNTKCLLHVGTIYGFRVNEFYVLLNALKIAISTGVIRPSEFKLIMAGFVSKECSSMIADLGLGDVVKILPPVSHEVSLSMMKGADYLLLFSGHEMLLPTKLFEYIATRKPIINIGHVHGEAANLIREFRAGISCDLNVQSVLEVLKNLDGVRNEASPSDIPKLGRRVEADSMVKVFEEASEEIL